MKLKEAVIVKPGSKYDKIAESTIHGTLYASKANATPHTIVGKIAGSKKSKYD